MDPSPSAQDEVKRPEPTRKREAAAKAAAGESHSHLPSGQTAVAFLPLETEGQGYKGCRNTDTHSHWVWGPVE